MTRTLATAASVVAFFAVLLLTPVALTARADGVPVAAPFMAPVPPACTDTACREPSARATEHPVEVVIGNTYPGAHLVTEPGRYGLSEARPGEVYAVVKHTLVRLDRKTFKALSVLRQIEGPRD